MKLGLSQPQGALEVAVIQTGLLENTVKFTELCAPPKDVMNPDMFSGLASLTSLVLPQQVKSRNGGYLYGC